VLLHSTTSCQLNRNGNEADLKILRHLYEESKLKRYYAAQVISWKICGSLKIQMIISDDSSRKNSQQRSADQRDQRKKSRKIEMAESRKSIGRKSTSTTIKSTVKNDLHRRHVTTSQ
jgi:hypothetical protein